MPEIEGAAQSFVHESCLTAILFKVVMLSDIMDSFGARLIHFLNSFSLGLGWLIRKVQALITMFRCTSY